VILRPQVMLGPVTETRCLVVRAVLAQKRLTKALDAVSALAPGALRGRREMVPQTREENGR
jgi:hypothetical protein